MLSIRVQQLVYVAYVCTHTFISICIILGMHTLAQMHIFPTYFLMFSKKFLVLTVLYILKSNFIYLSLEETDSLLFTFVLKKLYFSIFHRNYLINISPYQKAHGQFMVLVRKQLKMIMHKYVIFIVSESNICTQLYVLLERTVI